MSSRADLFTRIGNELDRAYAKHGAAQWGRHEFYAVLKEEVDELWDAIKDDEPQERVLAELVQVAAMCFRYYETGDRYAATPCPNDTDGDGNCGRRMCPYCERVGRREAMNDPGPIPTPQVNEPRPRGITREDAAPR